MSKKQSPSKVINKSSAPLKYLGPLVSQTTSTLTQLKGKVLQIIIMSKNDRQEAQRRLNELTFLTRP